MKDDTAHHNSGTPFDEQDLRGMPRDLSWYYLTPPEYTRRLATELHKQSEAHEAKVGPVLPPVKADQKLKPTEILQYLAAAKFFYCDEPDARIPVAMIDSIAIAVAGKRAWDRHLGKLAGANDDRQTESDRVGRLLRAEADKQRALNPGISDDAIAGILAKTSLAKTWIAKNDETGRLSARTIRRYIAKNK